MSASSAATDPTVAGTRRYRSKAQRPCDLCRARKALCNIPDPLQPCQLCKRIGRECTFVGNPGRRPKGRQAVSPASVSGTQSQSPTENVMTLSPGLMLEAQQDMLNMTSTFTKQMNTPPNLLIILQIILPMTNMPSRNLSGPVTAP